MVGEFNERSGDVARELETLAEACHADLIVVGRSRHPALHLGGVPRRRPGHGAPACPGGALMTDAAR